MEQIMGKPNTVDCACSVTDYKLRFPRTRQCNRKPTQELAGYRVCTQHAKEAKTKGVLHIAAPGTFDMNYIDTEVERDPELAAKAEQDRMAKARQAANSSGWQQAQKWKHVAQYLAEFAPNSADVDALFNANAVDIEALIHSFKTRR